jgi:hypothetical protein
MYVDRLDVKIIPAGGLLWEPNPQTRWDIFFPQPKLAQYLTTLGNNDIWWYAAAEWGGDTWTFHRDEDDDHDRFEYKDIRVLGGIEWGSQDLTQQGRRCAFIEAGWVLDRSVIYLPHAEDNFTLRDTFVVRGGIGY